MVLVVYKGKRVLWGFVCTVCPTEFELLWVMWRESRVTVCLNACASEHTFLLKPDSILCMKSSHWTTWENCIIRTGSESRLAKAYTNCQIKKYHWRLTSTTLSSLTSLGAYLIEIRYYSVLPLLPCTSTHHDPVYRTNGHWQRLHCRPLSLHQGLGCILPCGEYGVALQWGSPVFSTVRRRLVQEEVFVGDCCEYGTPRQAALVTTGHLHCKQ